MHRTAPQIVTAPPPATEAATISGSRLHYGVSRSAPPPFVPSSPRNRPGNSTLGRDPWSPSPPATRSPWLALPLTGTGKNSCRAPAGIVDAGH